VSTPLAGLTVVVTRPAAQAGRFIELATAAGADCVAFPTLVIERLPPGPDTRAQLQRQDWDWAIYTSTNAVEAAAAQGPLPHASRTAAVGRATERALAALGVAVDARPESANSEGLLALPEFGAVAGSRVLIVKGRGGRDLMRQRLGERGAEVTEVALYERRVADPGPASLAALRAALELGPDCCVAVTSEEILAALLRVVPAADARGLRDVALVVPGERVARAARDSHGWRGPVFVAATAEDAAMLDALRRHRTGAAAGP
jgi:uroporphyrinogen-III synthase